MCSWKTCNSYLDWACHGQRKWLCNYIPLQWIEQGKNEIELSCVYLTFLVLYELSGVWEADY